MITREDILEQAAARIYLGIPPARAIASAYKSAFPDQDMIGDFTARDNLTLAFAYVMDVSPELSYTLFYPTAMAKLTMSPYLYGSIVEDFTHRGESAVTVSKYLLAFAKGGDLNQFPGQLADLVDAENLVPLPSRASGPGPLVSPPAEPGESELFDPDLDEEDEGYLYDDLAD